MTRVPLAAALVACVVASAAASGAAVPRVATGGPPAPAGPAPAVASTGDGPRFLDAPYREHAGDVVRVPVAVPNGSAATVAVAGNDTGFAATLTLRDGDGDGLVTLLWNTYLAGSEPPDATFGTAGDGDVATVRSASLVVGRLEAGAYALRVAAGANATVGANETPADRARLRLAGDRNATATVLTARGELFGDLSSRSDLAAARRSGALVRPPAVTLGDERVRAVVPGDLLALRVRAPGLSGALAAADGPNATARFEALLDRAFRLLLVEHRATIQVEEEAAVARLGSATRRRVVADPANDTYHVLVDTRAPVATSPDHDGALTEDEEAYVVVVGFPPFAESRYDARENGSAAVQFARPTPSVAVSGPAGPNGTVTVAGTAGVPPGSEVVVGLRGDPPSLPVERRVRVDGDGRFEATFSLPSASGNASFEAVVRHDGEQVAAVPVTAPPEATLDLEAVVTGEEGIRRPLVDGVTTTHGGFVVVRLGSADGPVVGVSGLLAPGEHHDVPLATAEPVAGNATLVGVVHRDADADRQFDPAVDRPYPGDPADRASLVDLAATPTPTPSSTPSATPSRTPPPSSTPSPSTPPPSSGPIPAPGAGVAALAVVAAAVLATRRGGGRR